MWTWKGRYVCIVCEDDDFGWLAERGYVAVAPD